jgi:ubiquinone/menaquinone biosynthesis C-methylase UbiE
MKKKSFKEKKLRDEVWQASGWGKVASWYQNTINTTRSTQKDLILPEILKFLPLSSVSGKRIIDLGCGTGFFLKEYLKGDTQKSLGVDIDSELIELSKQYLEKEIEDGKVLLLKGDVTNLNAVSDGNFDIALSIESLPNIKDMNAFALESYRVLDHGGKLVLVVNHPSFRIPQSSDWHFDKDKNKQGRVVYKYKTAHQIKIDMNPGTKNKAQKVYTYTYHRPFEEYLNTFTDAGFNLTFMKEICSNKLSQKGARQKVEDIAREEIPLFLFLEFTKK